jgi:hypothetical protein
VKIGFIVRMILYKMPILHNEEAVSKVAREPDGPFRLQLRKGLAGGHSRSARYAGTALPALHESRYKLSSGSVSGREETELDIREEALLNGQASQRHQDSESRLGDEDNA